MISNIGKAVYIGQYKPGRAAGARMAQLNNMLDLLCLSMYYDIDRVQMFLHRWPSNLIKGT